MREELEFFGFDDAAVVLWLLLWTLDPEVPGSSPEWVPIFYEARSTAHGLPEPSFLRGSTLGTRDLSNIKTATGCESNRQLQL